MSATKKLCTFMTWLLLLLLGCAADRAALGAELAEPSEIEASGRYVHEPSGMAFPEAVRDFNDRSRLSRRPCRGPSGTAQMVCRRASEIS